MKQFLAIFSFVFVGLAATADVALVDPFTDVCNDLNSFEPQGSMVEIKNLHGSKIMYCHIGSGGYLSEPVLIQLLKLQYACKSVHFSGYKLRATGLGISSIESIKNGTSGNDKSVASFTCTYDPE